MTTSPSDPHALAGGISDAELIRRVAEGDTAAFAEFYDRHAMLLFSIALKVLGDRREAEEILQDAARILWESARLYDPTISKPSSWAVVITRHRAIDRLRRLKRQDEAITRLKNDAGLFSPASHDQPQGAAEARETGSILRAALDALPSGQRLAIELAFFGGLSHSDIATELGEPLGTIKARIRRGMLAMREVLEHQL
jgi:RNA polymerase sigma-70 factor (ECF subfamily)